MGKLSRLSNLGEKYTQRIENIQNGLIELKNRYDKHIMDNYPKMEEDSEGTMIWENPKLVKMKFKNLTPQQGYVRTIDKFNRLKMARFINCYIEGKYVVVHLP